MSIIIRPSQFYGPDVSPLDITSQAQMDLALRLALSVMLPPVPNAWRGADAKDCELAVEAIERVTSLYLDFVATVVKNINENVPVTDRHVDLKQFVALIEDAKNDAIGVIEIAGANAAGV